MVVSLKANKKRLLAFGVLALIVVGACFFLGGAKPEKAPEISCGTNEERVAYLQSFGWTVDPQPTETREVLIPEQFSEVYVTYNVMQIAQGFDLKPYAGATCTQYRYHITNYPDEPEVYATMLVHGEILIGGDIACAEVDGFMHGFAKDSARYGETAAASPAPTEAASPAPGSSAPEATPTPAPAKSTAAQSQGEEAAEAAEAGEEQAAMAQEEAPEDDAQETGGEPEEAGEYPTD